MNARCYKTVFSKRLGARVAVGEHASSQGKATGASAAGYSPCSDAWAGSFWGALSSTFALVALVWATPAWAQPAAHALPTGGQVVQGAVQFNQSAQQLNITQSTDRAAINWQSFDIGAAAKVNIQQPSAQSVLLNRVGGESPSQIFGQLNANGQVILVNPNGMVFGKDGSVSAAGFTGSTLNISDADFMAGKERYTRSGTAASTSAIVNRGLIQAAPGGYVALLGASVSNEGRIEAPQGNVFMAAADAVTLPSPTVGVPIGQSGRIKLELTPASINAAVSNAKDATIVTEGGQVYLQAAALNQAMARIIQSGSIDTTGVQGGQVHVLADGGRIRVDGQIKANSTNGSAGGDIYIGRDKDTNVLASVGDASGAKLESLGGFIETSGDYLSTRNIQVKAKDWLLDPTNIRIVAPGTTTAASSTTSGPNPETTFNGPPGISDSLVFRDDIQNAINAGTSVKIDTANSTPGANGSGNITIETALSFFNNTTNAATLSLLAKNGITQNATASITNTGSGLVHVVMVAEGLPGGVPITAGTNNTSSNGITLNSTIKTNGDVTITGTSANNAQHGVRFSNGSGIDARSYNVTGRMTASSGGSQGLAQGSGVVFTGTSVFNSTADSKITASTSSTGSADVFGMHFHNGSNVSFDTRNAKLVAATDAANMGNGVKIGWAGGAVINTQGDVTLGSLNANAFTHVQGKINAQGGNLTLLGRSANDGVQFQDGGGVGPEIIGTKGANITISGESRGGGTGVNTNRSNWGTTVISTSETSSANTAGNISITGTSASGTGIINSVVANITNTSTGTSTKGGIKLEGTSNAGNNHGINSAGLITAAGLVEMDGTANGQRSGVRVVAKVEGGSVDIYGSSVGDIGVDVAAMVKSTDASTQGVTLTGFGGSTWQRDNQGVFVRSSGAVDSASKVSIVGTNNRFANWGELMGTKIQGTVLAAGDINLEGHSTGGSSNHGLVINSTVTSIGGDIKATATNRTSEKVALLISGAGALIANGNGKSITMVADTMDFKDTTATHAINAGSTGTANITTKDETRAIRIGVEDGFPVAARLSLNQAELNKITAAKTVIGDNLNTGGISVDGVVTTNASTGNITLLTAGNIAVNRALTVGGTGASNNLTLNGAGATSTITQGAAIKAAGLELLGANATHALNNTGNDIKKLAGNTGTVSLTINAAFAIDTVNTVGLTTTGNTTLNSTAAVTQTQAIKAAGLELLGTGGNYALTNTGNDIKKLAGNTGTVSLTNNAAFAIDTVNTRVGLTTSGNTTLNSTAAVTQNQAIKAAGLELLGAGGNYTLTNTGNDIKKLAGNTGTVSLTNNAAFAIDTVKTVGLTTSGNTTLNSTAEVTQASGANIKAAGLALVDSTVGAKTGTFALNNDNNEVGTLAANAKTVSYTNKTALAVGDVGSTSGVTATGDVSITTKAGDLTLKKNITAANVNLNAAGAVLRDAAAVASDVIIKASLLRIKAGAGVGTSASRIKTDVATLSMESAGDQYVTEANAVTVAAKSTGGSVNIDVTTEALTVGSSTLIDGISNTTAIDGISADKGIALTAQAGNLNINKAISNATSGDVVLGAGVLKAAGDGTGGDVKTTPGVTVTNSNADGGTYIFTGSAATTGLLSHLDNSFLELRLSGDMGTTSSPLAQNADSNVKYALGTTIAGGAKAQVMFREKIALNTSSIEAAVLDKTYGDANTTGLAVDQVALFAEMQAKLKQANPGQIITRSLDVTTNGAGEFKVSKAAVINDMTGSLAAPVYSTSNRLTAKTHDYGALTSSKYTATLDAGKAQVKIAKLVLTGASIGSASNIYGGTVGSGVVDLTTTNKISGDILGTGTAIVVSAAGDFSSSGNLKANTYNQKVTALSGADAGNYDFTGVTGIYTVDRKPITLSGITADNKVYDGTTNATLLTAGTFTGKVDGDDLTVASRGTFDTKNVGTGKTVNLTNTLEGKDLGNYTITDQTSTTANVTPKPITLGGITADNKVYDGLTNATLLTAGTFTGKVDGDDLTVASTGTFDNKNVGTGKTVTLSNTLGGTDLGNYTIANQTSTTANVTPKPLTIDNSSAADKVFDGNTNALVRRGTLVGLVDGESLEINANGNFEDAAVGNNKAVNANFALANGSNGLASNYLLTNAAQVLRASILAAVPAVAPDAGPRAPTATPGGRVNFAGASGVGAATGVSDEPINPEVLEQCSVLNPEKCECEETRIPGVELCFAPTSVAILKD